jgi:hypothetical protein
LRRAHQRGPVIGHTAGRQHLGKNVVWVGRRAGLAERSLVVQPRADDDLPVAAEAEEKPESAEEFGAPPVGVLRAERLAETVFAGVRVAGDLVVDDADETREELDLRVLVVVARGQAASQALDLVDERRECIPEGS